MIQNNYDVIIVGTGASGLYSAISLDPSLKVLLISKNELTLCNSALAQGGIAGVYKSPNDDISLHQNDTLIAGGFKNNIDTVHILVSEACKDIEHIIQLGVDFDKNPDGTLHRTLEGGHSKNRIFHHKDATGFEVVKKLLAKVQTMDNVTIMDNALLCNIKKTSTGFSTDILKDDVHTTYNCHFLILATGGIGRLYEYTTNSAIATGNGIMMAYELGADIKKFEFYTVPPNSFQ